VTLVEVSDFQCPFCREWAVNTYPKVDSAYVRTGKVKMVFITFPLPNHKEAWPATEAALCAGVQGQFWPMHDRLFATQREWSGQENAAARFAGFAADLKLDLASYRACTDSDAMAPLIVNDVMQASGAGINGTPAFIINGQKMLSGAIPFEDLAREIENALAAAAAVQGATR
jgi:protein-disulfide isomerase